MHSTDILYTDPYAEGPQPEAYIILHNGDFSGDVILNVEIHHIRERQGVQQRHGQNTVDVRIPFEVLARIVADAVRNKKISDLGQADPREILGL